MSYVRPYKLRQRIFEYGGTTTLDPDAPKTLEDAVEQFGKHVRRGGARPQSVEHYKTILSHDLDLEDGWPLTKRVLERWRDNQLGLAEATQFTRFAIMRQFVNWLMTKIPMDDPMEGLPKPDRPKPKPYKKTATSEELDQMLRTCDKRDWWDHRLFVLIMVLRNTGLRVSEALKLRWRNIAWDTPVLGEAEISIEPEDEEDEKKNHAQKADDADDFAHMTEPAFSALRDWHKRLVRDGLSGNDQWVFPVTVARGFIRDGKPLRFRSTHWSTSHVWQMFMQLSYRARLTRPVNPHMLRHSAGTEFATKTGDLEATRIFMRHSDYTMVKAYLDTRRTREHMMSQHRKMAK